MEEGIHSVMDAVYYLALGVQLHNSKLISSYKMLFWYEMQKDRLCIHHDLP